MADLPDLAVHPKYYGKKMEPGMRLPGDTRLFRNIKLYEVPQWLMKRDWSPIGMWFSVKRFKYSIHSKWLLKRNAGGNFFAMVAVCLGIFNYYTEYPRLKSEMQRRYH